MDLISWVRGQHRGIRWFFETTVLSVLTPDQLRERPGGQGNSILWLMWHAARTEDLAVNAIIRGEPQILLSEDWPDRLGIDAAHIGTGLSDEEVAVDSAALDPSETDAYWKAVADRTSAWLKTADPESFDEVPDLEQRTALIPAVLAGADGPTTLPFWEGRSVGFLFGAIVLNHGYIHLGEMQAIRGRLGVRAWV